MEAVEVVLAEVFRKIQELNLEEVDGKIVGALVERLEDLGAPSEFWQEVYSFMQGGYDGRKSLIDALDLFKYLLDDFVKQGLIDAETVLNLRMFVERFKDTLFPRSENCVRMPSVTALETFFVLAYGNVE
ncbi:hypothetical protein [Thermococcus nautili]|uniref:Uncharacterized protein n=1 Tax=Thermococcus nautili TaxID=195522 RepID=W8NUJ7_9EURY|nr:hypothetical protein [Thermococcus nautili]AHL22812.1 hypothetical protein BD01_1195 [Thermococcus nautili]